MKSEKYLQDGGLRARTTVKDDYSKAALKHQLSLEIETLSRQLVEQKGNPDSSLHQAFKSMIQARSELLKSIS